MSSGRCRPGCWHVCAGLGRLAEEQSSTSDSKMAAGAAAVQMLQTFGSFRHRDASGGPAHSAPDVTAPAQSELEPRRASGRNEPASCGLAFYRPFPPFNPGPVRGHEGAAAVLPGALPPGEPGRRGRSSGRVLRGPEQLEGTEPTVRFLHL